MADIPIIGVPSSYRVPFWGVEILFGEGPSTTGLAPKEILLVMPKLSAGTYIANKIVSDVRSESAVIAGAGAGSMIHRAFRMVQGTNPQGKVSILPYDPSSGVGLAPADLDITWVTNPTAAGFTELEVQGELLRYDFTSNDTVTTIATIMADKVNAVPHLAVTASNVAGVLTLVAKTPGASQGDGTTGVIRVRLSISGGVGTTVTTENGVLFDALGLGTATTGADGAITEAANLLAALDTIKKRYYYTVISMFDAVGVGHLRTHIANNALPRNARRGFGIFAFTGVRATAATRAIAQNFERLCLILQQRSHHDCAELAGWLAGVRQKRETQSIRAAYDDYVDDLLQLRQAFDEADWPDDDDLQDSISDGVTEIKSNGVTSSIAMLVNTRSKDDTGSFDEFKATEPHRVVIMDQFSDNVVETFQRDYKNFALQDDRFLPDGVTVDTNRTLPARTLTPFFARAVFLQEIALFDQAGHLQQVATKTIPSLIVKRDPDNTGRLEAGASFRTIDIAHQVTMRFTEETPG